MRHHALPPGDWMNGLKAKRVFARHSLREMCELPKLMADMMMDVLAFLEWNVTVRHHDLSVVTYDEKTDKKVTKLLSVLEFHIRRVYPEMHK